jgi:hypothetical protein
LRYVSTTRRTQVSEKLPRQHGETTLFYEIPISRRRVFWDNTSIFILAAVSTWNLTFTENILHAEYLTNKEKNYSRSVQSGTCSTSDKSRIKVLVDPTHSHYRRIPTDKYPHFIRFSNCGPRTIGGPLRFQKRKTSQKLCKTPNEWKIHPYMSVLKVPLSVDLQTESRRISSFHNFLSWKHYFRKYSSLNYRIGKMCEISSSHGGEYDVQNCLLGYTAV